MTFACFKLLGMVLWTSLYGTLDFLYSALTALDFLYSVFGHELFVAMLVAMGR
jgi:hypothetical protein